MALEFLHPMDHNVLLSGSAPRNPRVDAGEFETLRRRGEAHRAACSEQPEECPPAMFSTPSYGSGAGVGLWDLRSPVGLVQILPVPESCRGVSCLSMHGFSCAVGGVDGVVRSARWLRLS